MKGGGLDLNGHISRALRSQGGSSPRGGCPRVCAVSEGAGTPRLVGVVRIWFENFAAELNTNLLPVFPSLKFFLH